MRQWRTLPGAALPLEVNVGVVGDFQTPDASGLDDCQGFRLMLGPSCSLHRLSRSPTRHHTAARGIRSQRWLLSGMRSVWAASPTRTVVSGVRSWVESQLAPIASQRATDPNAKLPVARPRSSRRELVPVVRFPRWIDGDAIDCGCAERRLEEHPGRFHTGSRGRHGLSRSEWLVR